MVLPTLVFLSFIIHIHSYTSLTSGRCNGYPFILSRRWYLSSNHHGVFYFVLIVYWVVEMTIHVRVLLTFIYKFVLEDLLTSDVAMSAVGLSPLLRLQVVVYLPISLHRRGMCPYNESGLFLPSCLSTSSHLLGTFVLRHSFFGRCLPVQN